MARTAVPVLVVPGPDDFAVSKGAGTAGDPVNGMLFNGNDGGIYLEVENPDVADHTVNVIPAEEILGLAIEDLVVTIPAGETKLIGSFPPGVFSQVDTSVWFTVDDASLLLWAVNGGAGS